MDQNFMRIIKTAMLAERKFAEWQREREEMRETERQRLIMRIIAEREKSGLIGITLTELVGLYNTLALKQYRVGESTLSIEVNELVEKLHYLKKEANPKDRRQQKIMLDEAGKDYLRKSERLQKERLEIYAGIFEHEPEKQAIVTEFFQKTITAFRSKRNWLEHFGV